MTKAKSSDYPMVICSMITAVKVMFQSSHFNHIYSREYRYLTSIFCSPSLELLLQIPFRVVTASKLAERGVPRPLPYSEILKHTKGF